MGTTYQRGRIWWIKYHRDGRAYFESTRSSKEGVAKRLLRLREGNIEHGLPITPKVGRMRFGEGAKDLVTEYRVNGRKSADQLEAMIDNHLRPFFGGRRLVALTTADVRTYIDQRQTAGAKAATINRELAALKRLYRLAIQAGKLIQHPHIPMLREDNARAGFFEREQFEAVRDHLPEPLRPVVTFGFYTGWRIQSEVLTLQWRQVDRTVKIIRLEPGTTKTRKGRTLPYGKTPVVVDLIEDQ